jgi:hypothetical protein
VTRRTLTSAALLVCVLSLSLSVCRGEPVEKPPLVTDVLTPEEAAAARRTIVAWLECEECIDGELEAVVRLGPVAERTLANTLIAGPSPAARALLERELRARYQELREYASTRPKVRFEMSEDEFVEAYLSNTLDLYGVRSAHALAALGGPGAEDAFRRALEADLRPDVQRAVQAALDGTIGAPLPAP